MLRRANSGIVVVLLAACAGCTNLLLSPSRKAVDAPGETEKRVSLPDGASVQIWTTRSAAAEDHPPKAYVLRFCGNEERAEDAAWRERQTWGELPVEIWAMNYPGFGASGGQGTLASIPPAALATYDALCNESRGEPVFISGTNVGSAAALYVATQRPVAGLILRSPPPIKQSLLGSGWWNLWLISGPIAAQVPPQLDSIKNARRVAVPAIFVITGDESVPRKYQRLVSAAYAGEKRVIVTDPTRHNSPAPRAAEKKLESDLRWLWSHGVPTGTSRRAPSASATAPQTRP